MRETTKRKGIEMLYFAIGFLLCYAVSASVALSQLSDKFDRHESDIQYYLDMLSRRDEEVLRNKREIHYYKEQLNHIN
jgi:hypothetical protein